MVMFSKLILPFSSEIDPETKYILSTVAFTPDKLNLFGDLQIVASFNPHS